MSLRSAFALRPLLQCRNVGKSCAFRGTVRCMSTDPNEKWIMKSPYTVETPVMPYTQYIFESQEKFADRTAFVNGITDESFTNREFRNLANRLGSALTRLGVTKGDVVGIVSPNCPEFAISFFAVAVIGATITTVNCTYTAEEIAQQLMNSGAVVVITDKSLLETIEKACQIHGSVRHIIVNGSNDKGFPTVQELLKDDGTAFPQNVEVDPREDILVLPYSSGTTGLPKGVMLTHYNMVSNMQQMLHPYLFSMKWNDESYQEVLMGVLPFFHIYGMVVNIGLSLYTGSKTVTLPGFEPNQYVNILRKYKITYLYTVPPIINFLIQSNMVKPEDLDSVHTMVCGAAPVGPVLIKEFRKKFGERIQFQEAYGMTEASPLTHLTPKGKYKAGSTGVTVPNTMAKIVDISSGETLGPNVTGELCVHGPQVMKGYYGNEKATLETVDKDGWLHTGDIAIMDEEQNVFIVDRLKELIKVKGLQVAPAELEDLLRKHPDIVDVAVIGLPDERAGEVPRAYVILAPGSNTTADAIENFIASQVAPHKRLAGGVHFVSKIPKSSTGKILRRELKAEALKSC